MVGKDALNFCFKVYFCAIFLNVLLHFHCQLPVLARVQCFAQLPAKCEIVSMRREHQNEARLCWRKPPQCGGSVFGAGWWVGCQLCGRQRLLWCSQERHGQHPWESLHSSWGLGAGFPLLQRKNVVRGKNGEAPCGHTAPPCSVATGGANYSNLRKWKCLGFSTIVTARSLSKAWTGKPIWDLDETGS